MAGLKVRNLDYIRSAKPDDPLLPNRIFEALSDLKGFHQNTAQQTNASPTGEPQPPSAINGLQVTGNNGHFQVAITDNNQLYRGVRYYVQHASTPDFRDAVHTQASGTELRNHNEYLGNVDRYWRAYSSYPWSGPSAPVILGGPQPKLVNGGGAVGGPSFLPSQGTGTGPADGSVSGPGPVAFRSTTGAPPVRQS